VVGGDGQDQIPVVLVGEDAQEAHAAHDVLARVVHIGHVHVLHHRRHELHQAARAHRRDHARVVARLDVDHGTDERLGHGVELRGLVDEVVVAREARLGGVLGGHGVAAIAGPAHGARLARAGLVDLGPLAAAGAGGRDVGEVHDAVGIGVRVDVGARGCGQGEEHQR
jgi:hypothetical protein